MLNLKTQQLNEGIQAPTFNDDLIIFVNEFFWHENVLFLEGKFSRFSLHILEGMSLKEVVTSLGISTMVN